MVDRVWEFPPTSPSLYRQEHDYQTPTLTKQQHYGKQTPTSKRQKQAEKKTREQKQNKTTNKQQTKQTKRAKETFEEQQPHRPNPILNNLIPASMTLFRPQRPNPGLIDPIPASTTYSRPQLPNQCGARVHRKPLFRNFAKD